MLTVDKLFQLVNRAYTIISQVRELMRHEATPRSLINAAWCYGPEQAQFKLYPTLGTCDVKANSNNQRRPLITMVGRDGFGHNIVAAQGSLQNQTTRAFNWWFSCALLYFYAETLKLITIMLLDSDRQQWGAVVAAQTRHVFSHRMLIRACMYHNLLQGLEKPKNLGRSGVSPGIYDLILHCLYDVAKYYETREEALSTLQCLVSFANKHLPVSCVDRFLAFVARITATLGSWAYYATVFCLTLKELTSNRCESENGQTSGTKRIRGVGVRDELAKTLLHHGNTSSPLLSLVPCFSIACFFSLVLVTAVSNLLKKLDLRHRILFLLILESVDAC
jgi:hypothetical protein